MFFLLLVSTAAQPNGTVKELLSNRQMTKHSTEVPQSIGQETAQLMLKELNETTVADQFGVYPDSLARNVEERFGLANDTAIALITQFGSRCPRVGPGTSTALVYQHVVGPSEALVYLGAIITCDAIYWHLSFGGKIRNASTELVHIDRIVVNATSTGSLSDPLAQLTAVAVARNTGILPVSPIWK